MTETTEQAAARIAGRIAASHYDFGGSIGYAQLKSSAEPILRDELPALAGLVVAVEVTADDYDSALQAYSNTDNEDWKPFFARYINARIRARAGAARIGIDQMCQQLARVGIEPDEDEDGWTYATEPLGPQPVATLDEAVQKLCEASYNDGVRAGVAPVATTPATAWVSPATVAGELVVPEDGWYSKRFDNGRNNYSASNTFYKAGEKMVGRVAAIRRIDTDEPTAWIERTARREWTAETVPQAGQTFWWVAKDRNGAGNVAGYGHSLGWFNRHVLRWCPIILPATGGDQ